jgi:hypothetical protein
MNANPIKISLLLVAALIFTQTVKAQYWDYVVTTKGDPHIRTSYAVEKITST